MHTYIYYIHKLYTMHMYIYIYIYRERERDVVRDGLLTPPLQAITKIPECSVTS